MFAKPRPKKSILPPPSKKRKMTSAVEEVNFDFEARQEYLTGFHKRKQQRIKNAQEEAAKRARQEKLEMRKQIREERKRDVEEHVQTVNRLLQESEAAGAVEQESDEEDGEWDGFPDQPELDIVDHEEEYIDEDRYTTVTVESVSVTRDGLHKPQVDDKDNEEDKKVEETKDDQKAKSRREPKKKKKKFRYETKFERQLTDKKQRIKKAKRRS
ncbi:nucleolar protein 12-domain-containing protein [Fusarium redolens]|uniref:Nucleolar protein 12-domain-containing protein n=1 Tax=Fusarium redolens TaxID=48865 RepID=A0A9P9KQK7_FUSRE|nr:nucleolar protein 12-domain-containing protein [Fusarium redolens]KAH7266711.1 nucleolar protein 12-domain-containing protein [Fusarium redolens]